MFTDDVLFPSENVPYNVCLENVFRGKMPAGTDKTNESSEDIVKVKVNDAFLTTRQIFRL